MPYKDNKVKDFEEFMQKFISNSDMDPMQKEIILNMTDNIFVNMTGKELDRMLNDVKQFAETQIKKEKEIKNNVFS